MDTGRDGDEVCLVVRHSNSSCCFNCLLQVPSGPNILWQHWGANQGKLEPGSKWCWPTWSTVSALVSKQTVTYNAQPKKWYVEPCVCGRFTSRA